MQAGQVVREILDSTPIDGIRPTGGGPTELRPTDRRVRTVGRDQPDGA